MTAATAAAFAAGGLHLPDTVAHLRDGTAPGTSRAAAAEPHRLAGSAAALRDALAAQAQERASRVRKTRAQAVRLARQATEDARERAEAARPKWVTPVVAYRLTAAFGDVGLWSSSHTGQDFAAPAGTPVRSVGDGRIIFAGWDGAYGNKVVVEHPDGTLTWYAHLLSIARTGGVVRAGDHIARVGSTGNSTGNHLHLEVRPAGGSATPPLPWLRARGVHA